MSRWYFISRSLTFDYPPSTRHVCRPLSPHPGVSPHRGCRAINATVRGRRVARPPAPSCPRSVRALGSRPFASWHAAHASGDRGACTAAAQQELLRAPNSSSAPQNGRAHTSLGHAALCLARTRRAGLGRPGSRSVPTASCAMRSTPLAQDLQRQHPSPVPPLQNAGVKWTQNGMGIRRRGPRRRLVI